MTGRSALRTLLGLSAFSAFLYFVGWPCPVRTLLGVPCPGCGLTRAARLILHGDVAGATRMHPLIWLVVPGALVVLASELRAHARTGRWGTSLDSPAIKALVVSGALLLFGVWIARFAGCFGGPAPG